MSPSSARWQQQINTSFEALVNDALLSPRSAAADLSHHTGAADCSDWRYAVQDLRAVCPTVDELRQPDWSSMRHLEQRSDSRDSGLESDAATDRHLATKKMRHCVADPAFGTQRSMSNNAPFNSSLPVFTEADNYQLYSALGRRKRHAAALTMLQHSNGDELMSGYAPHTLDADRTAFLRHRAAVVALNDISRPLRSKSKCFTT